MNSIDREDSMDSLNSKDELTAIQSICTHLDDIEEFHRDLMTLGRSDDKRYELRLEMTTDDLDLVLDEVSEYIEEHHDR